MQVILFRLLTHPQTQPYLGRVNGDILGAQHYISLVYVASSLSVLSTLRAQGVQ